MRTCRVVPVAVIAFMIVTATVAPVLAQDTPEGSVATVNGEPISLQQLQNEAIARYGPQVLQHLVMSTAIRQAAEEAGVEVTEKEIEERVMANEHHIEWRAPLTGVNFKKWLMSQNLTRAAFREKIHDRLLLEKMAEDRVNVSEQQVADYYSRNREKLRRPERVKVAHIVLPDAATAEDVRKQIVGEKLTFEEAAAKHSLDVWTRDQGGEWGYVSSGESAFQQAAMNLEEDGAISQPVQTPMGFHIIKRLEKDPAGVPPFEDIKEDINTQMEQQKLARLAQEKRLEILRGADVQQLIEFKANGAYSLPGDEAEAESNSQQNAENE